MVCEPNTCYGRLWCYPDIIMDAQPTLSFSSLSRLLPLAGPACVLEWNKNKLNGNYQSGSMTVTQTDGNWRSTAQGMGVCLYYVCQDESRVNPTENEPYPVRCPETGVI